MFFVPFLVAALLGTSSFFLYSHFDTESQFRREYREFTKNQTRNPEELKTLYLRFLPAIGTSTLMEIVGKNKACHVDSHELGKIVKRQTSGLTEAFLTCKDFCYHGCYHGVLMETFRGEGEENAHITVENISPRVKEICEEEYLHPNFQCSHAVGHGFMAATTSIKDVLPLCKVFQDKRLEYYCVTGIFMQNDLDYGERNNVDEKPLHYPCNEFSEQYGAACYREKAFRFMKKLGSFPLVLRECEHLTGYSRTGCFYGIGRAYTDMIAKNPSYLHLVCTQGEGENEKKLCIEGAMENLVEVYPERLEEICAVLPEELASFCRTIGEKEYPFSKETFPLFYPLE